MKISTSFVLAWTALAGVCGCSNQPSSMDMGQGADLSMEEADLRRPPGDLTMAQCELPPDHKAIDMVSTGTVVTTKVGEIFTAKIDATAGGATAFQKNPYVYVDLETGKRVDITDVSARKSKDWDIALKRWQIKINSGDSGPGGVTAVVVKGKELEMVTMAPGSGYKEDDYLDDQCMAKLDDIGGLATAMSTWYSYDNMRVSPNKDTWVLKRRSGMGAFKLQIMNYYDGGTSGKFEIRWGLLP